ncbi:MAG TPA: zinc-binding alcohol dehydrogenase family protein [Chthoniobacterales bacterium]
MKAVGYRQSLPVTDPESLVDLELPDPVPGGRDLLVQVKAVSVNPVDTKVRKRSAPPPGETKVLGYDAAGIVAGTGPEASLFQPGDEVWYAGSVARPGTNSELHIVDERIVGKKPASLSFAEAAAMPLTTITAWELLFDRLGVPPGKQPGGQSLLIVGAAGGVGSMLTQLARRLTGLTVIGTASRKETTEWVFSRGAHHVIDHRQPLSVELKRIGIPQVTNIASLTQTDSHFVEIVESLEPQGKLALIDDPSPIDVRLLKPKSLALCWESMFTRAVFQTADMIAQHRLLNEVADLVDAGTIRTTLTQILQPINADNLRNAHASQEAGRTIGKVVLTDWPHADGAAA